MRLVVVVFFTVGHSDHSATAFVDLLRAAGVAVVADVRRFPGSRHNPQFNADALSRALGEAGVGYWRAEALGGRRAATQDIPAWVNGFWRNRAFHNYADHALSVEFEAGLAELGARGRDQHAAVMCAEAVWWRCHRRIIADHLLALGEEVVHLMPDGRHEPARLTPGAVVREDHSVTYPAPENSDRAGSA